MGYRSEGRNIIFTGETWVNTRHFVTKPWTDSTVSSTPKQKFIQDLSIGPIAPKGCGQRYALIHAGNEKGFVLGAEYNFLCRKNTHDEVCAKVYENWFFNYSLPNLAAYSVIVLDNASYHSYKLEKIPTTSWKKKHIIQRLTQKKNFIMEGLLKRDFLEIVSQHKNTNNKYVLDEGAAQQRHIVLTITTAPLYLNPIELVWAQVKGYIRYNNRRFKVQDMPVVIWDGYENVSVQNWQNDIEHVMKIDEEMWELHQMQGKPNEVIINLTSVSSSSYSWSSDST